MDGAADAAAFVPLNRRFHEIITEASRLPRTVDILRTLRNAAALYVAASLDRHPDLVRSTNEEHRRILAALENRDGDRAAELIVDHLKNTVETLNTESAAQQGEH